MGYSPWSHKELDTTEQLSTHTMFTGALNVYRSFIYNSQDKETTKCPLTGEWIKKIWCIYIQWKTTQPFKK